MQASKRLVYLTVAAASSSTLLFELTQTRILSHIFWNHLVYLAVSLALLGFGISGTLVAIYGANKESFSRENMARLWMGFGISMFGTLVLTAWGLPLLHHTPVSVQLLFCYGIYVIPFIFAGAILSVTFSSVKVVGRLYSADLLCAGAACVGFFWLLPLLGAPVLVCALSVVAVLMASFWSEERAAISLNRSCAMCLATFMLMIAVVPSLVEFMCVDDKEMGEMMNVQRHAATRIESTTWTPLCRVDVVTNEHAQLIGYTEHAAGTYKVVTQDGTANTRIPNKEAVDRIVGEIKSGKDWRRFNAVYHIKKQPEVAVIGVGGGIDVISALAYDAKSIVGIELNPAIYANVQRNHEYMGNILKDPRVTLVNQEGRGALRASKKKFDVIQIDAIDTFAALSSGAYVLSENYLYTVEAFEDMFAHLKPGGILSIHRWRFIPPRETLRLTALACEAWKRQGVTDADKRIIVFGDDTWAISLFKNEPFTPEEFDAIRALAGRLNEGICLWPKVYSAEKQAALEDAYFKNADAKLLACHKAFDACAQGYVKGTERRFFDSYVYNVTPTTDDSPFFFEYHRLNAFGLYQPVNHAEVLGAGPSQADSLRGENNVGTTIFLILGQSTIFILLAVFWPLIRYQRQGVRFPGALAWSGYFAAIGLGFMVVEIGVIQKCVLFLGNPMYSLSVVLAAILVSAGLGSHCFAARGWDAAWLTRRVGPLFLIVAVGINFALNPLFYELLHLPLAVRMAVVVVAMFPLGFPMGMFFPAGLQAIRQRAAAFVPWAWGINGCASVYGSIIAILIAMVNGFDIAVVAGAGIYAVGFVLAQVALAKQGVAVAVETENVQESANVPAGGACVPV